MKVFRGSGICGAVRLLVAMLAVSVSACAEWQPFYQPPNIAPATTAASASAPPKTTAAAPTAAAGATNSDAAEIAIEKADRAAQKAAEAAKIAAEASAAAHDAAAAAAKASHGAPPSAAHEAPPTGAGGGSESSATIAPRPIASSTPTVVSDSSAERRDDAVKSIQEATAAIGRIDRTHLSDADAQSYDLAVNLLDGAQKSLTRKEYAAAASLSRKAAILLGTIRAN